MHRTAGLRPHCRTSLTPPACQQVLRPLLPLVLMALSAWLVLRALLLHAATQRWMLVHAMLVCSQWRCEAYLSLGGSMCLSQCFEGGAHASKSDVMVCMEPDSFLTDMACNGEGMPTLL